MADYNHIGCWQSSLGLESFTQLEDLDLKQTTQIVGNIVLKSLIFGRLNFSF